MHNKKIVTEDELSFKIIVKRSDLKKAEDLYNKGGLKKVNFDRKDDWSVCYAMLNSAKTEAGTEYVYYIWPVSWGYLGYADGWTTRCDDLEYLTAAILELGASIQTMPINQHSVITEIDEEN